MMRKTLLFILMLLLVPAALAIAEPQAPPEFKSGYTLPGTQYQLPAPRSPAWQIIDIAALAGALSLATYFVLRKRSRRATFLLMTACLLYFGFYRHGCVCAVGSVQNVAYAIFNPHYALPWVVAAYFLLPLAFTLFVGRVFCSGVCPLGAIQDAVLIKPIQLPTWLDTVLSLFAYAYFAIAVTLAATGSDFIVCQYDPFVGFFRLSGPTHMLFLGAVLLGMSMFVGRVYCRFICPYSVLLKILAPFARHRVRITPTSCIGCRLCEHSCPFGAIRLPATSVKRSRRRILLAALLVPSLPALLAWLAHRTYPSLTVTLVAGFLGLVIALKLLALALRRKESDYTADPADCLACARCYQYCPVEAPLAEAR